MIVYSKLSSVLAALVAVFSLSIGAAHADKRADVEALMGKAVAHYQSVGQSQAIKDFADSNSGFMSGDIYIVVQATDGNVIAHPINAKLNGKNLIGIKDTDGTAFVKEMVTIAESKGEGWLDYKWVHPETKKIAGKTTMVKRVTDGVFLTIGYYN